jgi:5-methylcytosine-specific restriction endonuclease McrA
MSAAVLVLDIGMQPHRVVSWQDAMCDIFLGKVEVVEYSKDKTIRGVNRTWPMPSVVRILRSFKRDRLRTKFSRINVYARDGFVCQYCGTKSMTEELTFDHVIPRAQGGKTTWENVVTCCIPCNREKADKTPTQAGMRLRSIPKKPHYLPSIMVRIGKDTPPEWKNYWRTELSE